MLRTSRIDSLGVYLLGFDTLVTIIVRGGLKEVTPIQVIGDVVTQDTYREERVEVENCNTLGVTP